MAKTILGLVPLMQSTALVSENVKMIKKKKLKEGDFIGTGVKNIIGTEFIKLQAQAIGSMS